MPHSLLVSDIQYWVHYTLAEMQEFQKDAESFEMRMLLMMMMIMIMGSHVLMWNGNMFAFFETVNKHSMISGG